MTTARQLAASIAVVAAAGATGGCGGNDARRPAVAITTATTAAHGDSQASVRRAVRTTLAANLAMSRRALWTNIVPTSAKDSTRGPALAALRTSVAQRRRAGVRVRVITPRSRLLRIEVDPAYTRATAIRDDQDRVRVVRSHGKSRAVATNEHATIYLRRIGHNGAPHFVVWRVSVK